MKIGFEREMFVINEEGKPQDTVRLKLPSDNCGYLCESRGEPHTDIFLAIASMLSIEETIISKINSLNLHPLLTNRMKFDRKTELRYIKRYAKGTDNERNLYGFIKGRKYGNKTAGLHIHFGQTENVWLLDRYGHMNLVDLITKHMDIPTIIRKLDIEFKEEIKLSKRQKGLYEIKQHGFEYRSLPCNINMIDVGNRLYKILIDEDDSSVYNFEIETSRSSQFLKDITYDMYSSNRKSNRSYTSYIS